MYNYGETLITTTDIIVEYDYESNNHFLLKKHTELFFVSHENNDLDNEYLICYLNEDKEDCVFINKNEIPSIKRHIDYYQEQFSHLNPENSYFGQLYDYSNFVRIENGEKQLYTKIGEYVTSDGIRYNAVKMPNLSYNNYWSIDKEQSYKDKEFFYFAPDNKIDSDLWDSDKEYFKIPRNIEVSELFVEYPNMLKVVERLFKKQDLAELKQDYDAYYKHKSEASEWETFGNIAITKVPSLIKEKEKLAEREKIMAEINRETEVFRQNLINKRLKF